MTEERIITTQTARILIEDDCFVRLNAFPGPEMTLEDAWENVAAMPPDKYVLLASIRQLKSISLEAR